MASYFYILLHLRCIILLISDIVIRCNDVITSAYYYVFLRIIDLCTKCR